MLNFLETEKSVRHIEDVEQKQIKAFLLSMSKAGRKANYVNDLLNGYSIRMNLDTGGIQTDHIYFDLDHTDLLQL